MQRMSASTTRPRNPRSSLSELYVKQSTKETLSPTFSAAPAPTAAVAEKLGRKWIATDLGKFGIHTTRKRLIGVQRERKAAGQSVPRLRGAEPRPLRTPGLSQCRRSV